VRRILLATILTCIVATMSAPSALATDHRVPRAVLFTGEASQRGLPIHTVWLRGRGRFCLATFADGLSRFPNPVGDTEAGPIAVRFWKADPPTFASVSAWERVDRNGQPKGEPMSLPFLLRPHLRDGAPRAWELVLALPPSPHLYLEVTADWPDEDGCGGTPDIGSQYGIWRFHVRNRTGGG
jgi:hypothetical protein